MVLILSIVLNLRSTCKSIKYFSQTHINNNIFPLHLLYLLTRVIDSKWRWSQLPASQVRPCTNRHLHGYQSSTFTGGISYYDNCSISAWRISSTWWHPCLARHAPVYVFPA